MWRFSLAWLVRLVQVCWKFSGASRHWNSVLCTLMPSTSRNFKNLSGTYLAFNIFFSEFSSLAFGKEMVWVERGHHKNKRTLANLPVASPIRLSAHCFGCVNRKGRIRLIQFYFRIRSFWISFLVFSTIAWISHTVYFAWCHGMTVLRSNSREIAISIFYFPIESNLFSDWWQVRILH